MIKLGDKVTVKQAELTRKQELEDVERILSTDFGRRFFIRMLDTCGQFRTSFTGNSETFLREGKRQIALQLLKDVEDIGLQGLDLKLAAEREYVVNQLNIKQRAEMEVQNEGL